MHISGVMQGSTSPAFTSLRVDMAANSGNVMVPWQVLWLLGGILCCYYPLFLLTCLFICLSSSAVATHVSRLQITPTIVSRVENTARPTL
ncbi:hypothetical protein HBI22_102450 [Parastagonospora nodorum]|nr:hypothetical protein HBI28_221310 [Parastagonospora nodorum]KAH5633403.1 hypothetical protein HBI22_102450 [Parastagonospora nodorum]